MQEESTAHGVNPEQLLRLFNIGRDTKKAGKKRGGSQHKAEMLCSSLSHTLPFDKSQIDMLPSKLSQLCHSIGLLAGDTIADLPGNPSTDMSYIKGIKLCSKELSARAESKAEHEVATAIYYAAIAHELAFRGERITRFSYKRLEASYAHLVREKWILKDLSSLFKTALKCCRNKAKS